MSSQYIEEYELSRGVTKLFKMINMPSNPFDLPIQKNVTNARIQAENTTIAEANFGTDKLTMDATKLTEFMILPEEMNEDSAPQILSLVRQEIVEAQGRASETAVMNGDDSATHMDDDTDGLVQRTEFVKYAAKLLPDAELADRVYDALDANSDGRITIPEYLRVWGQWARVGRKSAEERIAMRRAQLADPPSESAERPPRAQ